MRTTQRAIALPHCTARGRDIGHNCVAIVTDLRPCAHPDRASPPDVCPRRLRHSSSCSPSLARGDRQDELPTPVGRASEGPSAARRNIVPLRCDTAQRRGLELSPVTHDGQLTVFTRGRLRYDEWCCCASTATCEGDDDATWPPACSCWRRVSCRPQWHVSQKRRRCRQALCTCRAGLGCGGRCVGIRVTQRRRQYTRGVPSGPRRQRQQEA